MTGRHATEQQVGTCVHVLDGGPFTTVQDLPGRVGYWHVGVPPNGPMDDLAHQLANLVVGNRPGAAALELTGAGPTLRFPAGAVIALGGAPMPLRVDGRPAPPWTRDEGRARRHGQRGWDRGTGPARRAGSAGRPGDAGRAGQPLDVHAGPLRRPPRPGAARR